MEDLGTPAVLSSIPCQGITTSIVYAEHCRVNGIKISHQEGLKCYSLDSCYDNCHSPTESQCVRTVLQGLQKDLAKPVIKKLPVTAEMLGNIVDNVEESGSLADWQLATDELVHIRAVNIKFNDEFMSINIPRSKTDQTDQL